MSLEKFNLIKSIISSLNTDIKSKRGVYLMIKLSKLNL